MNTTSSSSLLLAFCFSTTAVFAQTAPAPTASTTPTSSTSSTDSGKKTRALSPKASSALSAGFTYQPPKPVDPKDEEEEGDLRETDRPRNEIIRLPKYMVEGERPPVFAERNLYSTKNLQQLALQRYLGRGINKYQLGRTGKDTAMQMYWDDERLKNITEVNNQISLYRLGGDEARAQETKEESNSLILRTNDARTDEMSKLSGQRY
jgi:hypothetical protein